VGHQVDRRPLPFASYEEDLATRVVVAVERATRRERGRGKAD
jgi:hypothetical protein